MLQLATAATVEPVTLAEAKAHLDLAHDQDDDKVAGMIAAAREVVELETGLALAEAEYVWAPAGRGRCNWRPSLPLWPAEVEGVTYYDGTERVAIDVADYRFDPVRGALTVGAHAEVEVSFTAKPGPIPSAIKSAILLLVSDLYENRGASVAGAVNANPAAARLIWPYRRNIGV